ncbi:MAG: energy-coupling factor ABC transporter permease [Proteobacteria bacterium]|nr:energy-coupling factor ABC transporter permease [Pseudomonadota bacterium]
MHMADALLSPAVGGAMWAATAATTAYCSKKVREEMDDGKIPLMGVLGAFIFASQMINFTIPGTGSSGHLGGGTILAILLGPYAAFLVMASVLTVQALFFADGGLLALGANIFNLGVFPCFVAYPFIYRPLAGKNPSPGRITLASVVAAVVGLQLGAFGVVLETVFSGISELPFTAFVLLMQPIHLGIGIVEGLVTAAVVNFVWKAQPEILARAAVHRPLTGVPVKNVLVGLAVVALVTGAGLSWFASANPDGLEWSMAKVSGKEELESEEKLHHTLGALQEKTAFLPDYGFKAAAEAQPHEEAPAEEGAPAWPAVDPGTSVSGIVGGFLTLVVAIGIGWLLRRRAVAA